LADLIPISEKQFKQVLETLLHIDSVF